MCITSVGLDPPTFNVRLIPCCLCLTSISIPTTTRILRPHCHQRLPIMRVPRGPVIGRHSVCRAESENMRKLRTMRPLSNLRSSPFHTVPKISGAWYPFDGYRELSQANLSRLFCDSIHSWFVQNPVGKRILIQTCYHTASAPKEIPEIISTASFRM